MEVNGNVNPVQSEVITPEAWAKMSPEQQNAFGPQVAALMNAQLNGQIPVMNQGVPMGGTPTMPAAGMTPNQDVVVPPPVVPQQAQKLTLAEEKKLRKELLVGSGLDRDWYEIWKVSWTSSTDISAILLGVALGVIGVFIVGGIVYLIKKQ